jgi:hypothetical protein
MKESKRLLLLPVEGSDEVLLMMAPIVLQMLFLMSLWMKLKQLRLELQEPTELEDLLPELLLD